MNKQEKMFASKVNRLRLEKEVFSLFRIEGQSIENVKKKTGLSKALFIVICVSLSPTSLNWQRR